MNKPIKIGLIGCGKQAPKHISGLKNLPGVQLVLADDKPEIARKLAESSQLEWVTNVDDLFMNPEIVAVDICTPTQAHFPLIEKAIKAGKHYFCEKPLCESQDEAEKINFLTTQHQLIGMIGYVYRFAPVFELAQKLFREVPNTGQSSELGRITSAFFRIGGRGSHQLWKHQKASGGGAINEMLVHMIDLALWFFGPVAEVKLLKSGLLRPVRNINGKNETVDAEDFVLISLEMASGAQVICQADLLTPAFTQFVEIQGDNGTFMGSIQPDLPSFVFCEKAVAGYDAGKTNLNFGHKNLFETQMAEFVHAVRTQTQPDRCRVVDSIALMKTLEMIRE